VADQIVDPTTIYTTGGTEANEKDAEAALCWLDRVGLEFDEAFCFQDHTSLAAERHEWHLPLCGYSTSPRPVVDPALPLADEGGKRPYEAKNCEKYVNLLSYNMWDQQGGYWWRTP